jgi:hypothetical protein
VKGRPSSEPRCRLQIFCIGARQPRKADCSFLCADKYYFYCHCRRPMLAHSTLKTVRCQLLAAKVGPSGGRPVRYAWGGTAEPRPGVFGLPNLHAPEDWKHIASACAERCAKSADAIRATRSSPSPHTLQLFDDLSNDICMVLDVYVHPARRCATGTALS